MNKTVPFSALIFLGLYLVAWILALPFLLFLKGLKPISRQRFGLGMPRGPFDLWIQAASVGEAKLALQLISELPRDIFPRIVVSSNTRQGMDTLRDKVKGRAELVFFPFDLLPAWSLALARTQPRQVLLLETEIWPGLLSTCKRKSIPVIIGNARMSLKSFCRYYPLSGLLSPMGPDRVLAVSQRDRDRFSWIFKDSHTGLMPNIKFDAIENTEPIPYVKNPLSAYFRPGHPLIVLGSVRREEEVHIRWLILRISSEHPKTTIALFPRHMNRIESWERFLDQKNISRVKRSEMQTGSSMPQVILWDKFGELLPACALAKSVFSGGSLAPCGGQNFLEPLSQGVVPCVGPFWDNFHWVGKDILSSNLLCQVADRDELYLKLIKAPTASRTRVLSDFNEFVAGKKGGTSMLINSLDR